MFNKLDKYVMNTVGKMCYINYQKCLGLEFN